MHSAEDPQQVDAIGFIVLLCPLLQLPPLLRCLVLLPQPRDGPAVVGLAVHLQNLADRLCAVRAEWDRLSAHGVIAIGGLPALAGARLHAGEQSVSFHALLQAGPTARTFWAGAGRHTSGRPLGFTSTRKPRRLSSRTLAAFCFRPAQMS